MNTKWFGPFRVQDNPKDLSESNTIVVGEVANNLKEQQKYYYLKINKKK